MGTAGPRRLRAVRRRIGTIAQGLDLAGPLRVMHNVNAGRLGTLQTPRALASLMSRRVDPDVAAALREVDLEGFAGRRTDELSGGEQQRVAIARVVLQGPDVVLADEPASSLDPGLSESIVAAITAMTGEGAARRARAVVLSLHDPELARRHCDRLIGLVEGRVVFDIDAAALCEDHLARVYAPESR